MQGWLDDQYQEHLGAPTSPAGYRHGRAGRLEDDCRVDCWVRLDNECLRAVCFEVFGSLEAVKMAGWLGHQLTGAPIARAEAVTGRWLAESLAVSAVAKTQALVIEDALRSALAAEEVKGGGC